MEHRSRREFLADVGKGMLAASVGTTLAADLGLAAHADSHDVRTGGRLTFGRLEPLVDTIQQTPPDRLLPLLVERVKAGSDLRGLVAAGALANARAFGGEDYIGFHAFMALLPAYEMSRELPAERAALPVLKVIYRTANQIQAKGADKNEVLHLIEAGSLPAGQAPHDLLREATYRNDPDAAERTLAAIKSSTDAFNEIQYLIQDDADVHRTVLAYRAWTLLDLTGKEYAQTTLRQTVRYCANVEKGRKEHNYATPAIRALLPRLFDQYKLEGRAPGSRRGDDAWLESLATTLISSTGPQAAEAVAAALAEGFGIDSVGEALVLAANQQLLRDPGRTVALPGKPIGSVHGDSIGVHASDSMNAWRNMARASSPRNALAGLIVGGYHLFAGNGGRDFRALTAYPHAEHLEAVRSVDSRSLLSALDGAIRSQDQARAAALTYRAGTLGMAAKPVFDLLLRYATSEDGALHAEKFYHTVREEFGRGRPAFKWRHLTALARVTASEYGKRADGYEEACRLLGV